MAEWGQTGEDYATRISHLTGSTPGGVNGPAVLVLGQTVANDGTPNTLTGGAGQDWFFATNFDVTDRVTSGPNQERLN